MSDFHAFIASALGFCAGLFFWVMLFWAIIRRGR